MSYLNSVTEFTYIYIYIYSEITPTGTLTYCFLSYFESKILINIRSLESLTFIQRINVCFHTEMVRWLVMPTRCFTQHASADSRGVVVSYWRKYEHEVLVNCLGLLYLLLYVHGKHLRSCRDGQLT